MTKNFTRPSQNFTLPSRPLVLAGLLMAACTATAQEAPGATPPAPPQLSGGPLRLDNVVTFTLTNSANLKMQGLATEIALSTNEIQSGFFDITPSITINGKQNRPHNAGGVDVDNDTLVVGVQKLFRSGISSNLSAIMLRDDNRVLPGDQGATLNNSIISFTVNIPLLKGRGYTSAAAEETASKLLADSAVQSYYDTVSKVLMGAISAYWEYRATTKTLEATQGSQQRVLGWVEEAKKAAEATGNAKAIYQKLAPQIARLDAFLSDQERKVSEATEKVNQAKGKLATFMGVTSDQMGKIGEPTDAFPQDWTEIAARFDKDRAIQKWMAEGLEKRFDLQALKLKEQASATRLAKARQDVLPQLNLGLSTGRTGYEPGNSFSNFKGSLTPSPAERRGTDLGVTLTFAYPLGNHVANGQLGIATASHQLDLIGFNEGARQARLEIATSISTLTNALQAVEKARKAVSGYEPVLEKYYRGGQSIMSDPMMMFNLIDIEKDVLEATGNYINSLLGLANIILALRQQTGVLIDVDPTTGESSLKNITALPNL